MVILVLYKNKSTVSLSDISIKNYYKIERISIKNIEDISSYPNFYQLKNITSIKLCENCQPIPEFSTFKKLRKIKTKSDYEYDLSFNKNMFISYLDKYSIIPTDTIFLNIGNCSDFTKFDNLPFELEHLRLTVYVNLINQKKHKIFTNLPPNLKKFELQVRGWKIFIEPMDIDEKKDYVEMNIINNMKLPHKCIFEYECISSN